jgi:hypothetical protein
MSAGNIQFILQGAALLLGGGTVQLGIFLIRRRAELRQLNTASDVAVNTVSDTLINRLQEDGGIYRARVKDLETKVEQLESRSAAQRAEFTDLLKVAHDENSRLTTRVAQLQTDLDIASRQIRDLQGRS